MLAEVTLHICLTLFYFKLASSVWCEHGCPWLLSLSARKGLALCPWVHFGKSIGCSCAVRVSTLGPVTVARQTDMLNTQLWDRSQPALVIVSWISIPLLSIIKNIPSVAFMSTPLKLLLLIRVICLAHQTFSFRGS